MQSIDQRILSPRKIWKFRIHGFSFEAVDSRVSSNSRLLGKYENSKGPPLFFFLAPLAISALQLSFVIIYIYISE